MNKNKTNLSVVNNAGIRVKPSIIVGEQGSYSSGDILDANAVEKVVKGVVGDAAEALDTLEELGGALPTKLSQLNNDTGYITEDAIPASMVEIIYSDLVELRDNSELVPGQWYRITDYVTTTAQEGTQSAGHPFDVVVFATTTSDLNENAKAVKHAGDTYFEDSNLNAWELKYNIDNDTSKYGWADAENGKGVIYYIKDELNNEAFYDFKNIVYVYHAGFLYNQYGFSYTYEKNDQYDVSVNNVLYYAYYRKEEPMPGPPAPPQILYSIVTIQTLEYNSDLYEINNNSANKYVAGSVSKVINNDGNFFTFTEANGNESSIIGLTTVRPKNNKICSGTINFLTLPAIQIVRTQTDAAGYMLNNCFFGCNNIYCNAALNNMFFYSSDITCKRLDYCIFLYQCQNIKAGTLESCKFDQYCIYINITAQYCKCITFDAGVGYVNLSCLLSTEYSKRLLYIAVEESLRGQSYSPINIEHPTSGDLFKTTYIRNGSNTVTINYTSH